MTKDFYLLMKSVISEVDPREEEEKGGKILFCESALMGWSVALSHVQDSVTAVVPEEFSSSSSPFPASAGLMFSSFATATPPPPRSLSSCRLPRAQGSHYSPGEAISYQDVPVLASLSYCIHPFVRLLLGIWMQSGFHPCHRLLSAVNPGPGSVPVVPLSFVQFFRPVFPFSLVQPEMQCPCSAVTRLSSAKLKLFRGLVTIAVFEDHSKVLNP